MYIHNIHVHVQYIMYSCTLSTLNLDAFHATSANNFDGKSARTLLTAINCTATFSPGEVNRILLNTYIDTFTCTQYTTIIIVLHICDRVRGNQAYGQKIEN